MRVVLASASPRRRALLSGILPQFEVEPSRFEEVSAGLSAYETARRNAVGKARDVAARHKDAVVIGSDTVVSLGGDILGKPKDAADAKRMLRLLSGRTHTVYTGVCLIAGEEHTEVAAADVTFERLSDETIDSYVASGKPLDKAGAYGIQDGYPLVRSYKGSFSCIMGLPVGLLEEMLRAAGVLQSSTEEISC